MTIPEGMRLNRPTDLGRLLGEQIARLTEPEIEAMKELGVPDLRCASCAFRKGTVPNGCESSLMDALKCGMEGEPFLCHEDKGHKAFCHGWVAMRSAMKGATMEVPWPYSDEVAEPTPETKDVREE